MNDEILSKLAALSIPVRRLIAALLFVALLNAPAAMAEPVQVLYFFQPGCPECEVIRRDVLPDLDIVFPEQYRLQHLDISVRANAERLIEVQEAFDAWDNQPVSMLVGGRFYLAGVDRIRDQLIPSIQQALDDPVPVVQPPIPVDPEAQGGRETNFQQTGYDADAPSAVARRVARFTILGVMAAGLVDSLNPCAISVLIFFISVLTMAKVRGRRLLTAGAAFIAASFTNYFLLGFGLLTVVRTLTVFESVKTLVDSVMIVILLVLAVISLRDAWVFHRRGNPADVRLQLSPRIKARIHRLARDEVRTHRLVVAAIIIGSSVTILESVCTGQVYVPALVLMARSGRSLPRVLGLLGLYNLMFVMPLIVIFGLVAKGLQMQVLLNWSRHHVAPAKLLMAALFLGMAIVIYVL